MTIRSLLFLSQGMGRGSLRYFLYFVVPLVYNSNSIDPGPRLERLLHKITNQYTFILHNSTAVMPIPDLPGRLIPRHSDEEKWLKAHVGRMCHLENDRCVEHPPIDQVLKCH